MAMKKKKKRLLLESFSEKYGIEIKDEEVLKYIRNYCEENRLNYDKKIKEFREKGIIEDIRNDLKVEKTMEKILEELKIVL